MQNIVKIKEVLTDLSSASRDLKYCLHPDDAEIIRKDLSKIKKNLLNTYNPEVSKRFESLDSRLHSLFKENFNSVVLSIGDLQQTHDTKVRGQHIDPNVFRNLLLNHIHPILQQIDHRLLAMNTTLKGFHVLARRNP